MKKFIPLSIACFFILVGWAIDGPTSIVNLNPSSGSGSSTNIDATNITAGVVAKARGGTGADNSSVTFPSSGTIPVIGQLGSNVLSFPGVTRLVFDGDSLTSSNNPPAYLVYFTNIYFPTLSGVIVSNVAVSGRTAWDSFYTGYTNNVQPCKPSGSTNAILFAWLGINDIYYNTNSPATIEATLSNYWTQAKSDGFTVVAFTITDRSDFPASTNEVERSQINTWIRMNPIWDYLVDVAALFPYNPIMNGSISEFTWDTIHFNTNAARIIADQAFNTVLRPRHNIPMLNPDAYQAQYIGTNWFGNGLNGAPSMAFGGSEKATGFYLASAGAIGISSSQTGASAILFGGTGLWRVRNTLQLAWASGDPVTQNGDVGLIRDSAGVLRVSNAASGTGALFFDYPLTSGGSATLTTSQVIYLLNVDANTVTLPTAVGATGRQYMIKVIAPAASGTVATTSSQKIDGATTYSLSASNKFVRVISDNANWWVLGSN